MYESWSDGFAFTFGVIFSVLISILPVIITHETRWKLYYIRERKDTNEERMSSNQFNLMQEEK